MNCANTQILFLVFIFVWAKIVHFPKYSNWKIQLQAITSLNSENVPLIQAIETIHLSLRLDNTFQDCLKVLYSSSRGSIFYSAFYYVAFFSQFYIRSRLRRKCASLWMPIDVVFFPLFKEIDNHHPGLSLCMLCEFRICIDGCHTTQMK